MAKRAKSTKKKPPTRDELRKKAKGMGIVGAWGMNKTELEAAIRAAKPKPHQPGNPGKKKGTKTILKKVADDATPDPNNLTTQITVWEAYAQTPSIAKRPA